MNKTIEMKEKNELLLEHARILMIHVSDIRIKNFNFFLILTGALITLFGAKFETKYIIEIISISGFVLSILFYILDVRGREMLIATNKELLRIEKSYGIHIQEEIKTSKFSFISHTFVYRSIYVIVNIVSIVLFLSRYFC